MVDESIKYHTSSIGSITKTEFKYTNVSKATNTNSALMLRYIGMKGSLPKGQPEYQGLDKTDRKFLGRSVSFARSIGVLS